MSNIDPITLEVVTEGLISVVREMRATVFRTARSVARRPPRVDGGGGGGAGCNSWVVSKVEL